MGWTMYKEWLESDVGRELNRVVQNQLILDPGCMTGEDYDKLRLLLGLATEEQIEMEHDYRNAAIDFNRQYYPGALPPTQALHEQATVPFAAHTCYHCGTHFDETPTNCPNCGSNKFV